MSGQADSGDHSRLFPEKLVRFVVVMTILGGLSQHTEYINVLERETGMGKFLDLDFAKLNLGVPYSKCEKEIKLLRRIIVVYLAKNEAEREKNGKSRRYTNEEIIKMIDVTISSGYRWINFELRNPGIGFKPSKTGPKRRGPKKLSLEQVEELKKNNRR